MVIGISASAAYVGYAGIIMIALTYVALMLGMTPAVAVWSDAALLCTVVVGTASFFIGRDAADAALIRLSWQSL